MNSVPPKLFHLTTLAALRKILRTNRLHTGAFRAVSFTEDPKLFGQDFEYGNDFGSLTVRIVVDGEKLSMDYPVEPHVDGSGTRFLREKEWRVLGRPVENLRDYVKCVEVLSRRPHDATDDYWKNRSGVKWNPKRNPDLRKKVLNDIIALGDETGFVVKVKDETTDSVCESLVRALIRESIFDGKMGSGIPSPAPSPPHTHRSSGISPHLRASPTPPRCGSRT